MRRLYTAQLLALPLLAAGLATSCIDNDYDMDNVDYTVGAETDLTLPTFSTDTIYLHNFMDMEEDGVIQFVWDPVAKDSVFCLKQGGEADIDPVSIDEIRIESPRLSSFDATVNLRDLLQSGRRGAQRPRRITITLPGGGQQTVELPSQSFHYDITPGDARYDITPATATGISADVTSIVRIGIDAVKVTLDVAVKGFPAYIGTVHYDGLRLACPEGVNITAAKFNETDCRIEDGVIYLTQETDTRGHAIADGIRMELTMDGVEEGESFAFDAVGHTATFGGRFDLTGSLRVESDEFLPAELEKLGYATLMQIVQSGDLSPIVPEKINVKGDAEMDGDLVLRTFSGQLKHDVGDIDPIRLDDLPDFLNDDNVVLDLDNPILLMDVCNGMPARVNTAITLKSNTCPTPVQASIELEQGGNKLYLADKKATQLPDAYATAQRIPSSGSVADLIKKVPERVDIDVDHCTMVAKDFDLRRSYDISLHYDIFAPLTFGPEFKMSYEDTETGLAEDLDDIEDVNFDRIELAALIDSKLPAGLKLTVDFTDTEGHVIPQLQAEGIDVRPNAKGQRFTISIKAVQGHTINDALAGKNGVGKLDGIRYRAELVGEHGAVLYRNASIRIYDVKASLKGKVTIDMN